MFQYISDVRQAVKYAMSDYKGKELPGFSLPKKVVLFSEPVLKGNVYY